MRRRDRLLLKIMGNKVVLKIMSIPIVVKISTLEMKAFVWVTSLLASKGRDAARLE